MGGLTGTIADTAAHATFDKRYIRKRIERRESDRPDHIIDGTRLCVRDSDVGYWQRCDVKFVWIHLH